MNEVVIGLLITIVVFIAAVYRSGEKNGYFAGYKQGKEETTKEYEKTIEELERLVNKYDYYR